MCRCVHLEVQMCMASGNSPRAVSSALPGLYQQPPSLVLAVLDLLPLTPCTALRSTGHVMGCSRPIPGKLKTQGSLQMG